MVFLLIGLIFSQPIVLGIFNYVYEKKFNQFVMDREMLEKESIENRNAMKEDKLQVEISKLNETLNQIKLNNPSYSNSKHDIYHGFDPRRKAFIVGNQAYPAAPLNNPVKDANDLSNKLNKMGFNVTLLVNAPRKEMELGLRKYLDNLKPGDISLFYFSGHGFQEKGNNYLVPLDFIDFGMSKAFSLNMAIDALSSKSLLANVIIIDACRSFSTGLSGGLASTEAGVNTYIAFASKPGQSAQDGIQGSNGVFTGAILKYIDEPSDIDSVFRSVRDDVATNTKNSQETWTSHSLNHRLILTTNTSDKHSSEPSPKEGMTTSVCQTRVKGLPEEMKSNYLIDCTLGEIAKVNDDLTDLKKENIKIKEGLDAEIKKGGGSPERLLEVFYDFWTHPTSSTLLSIVTALLIAFGFILRFLFFDTFHPYARGSYYLARSKIVQFKLRKDSICNGFPYGKDLVGEDEVEREVVFETSEENESEEAYDEPEQPAPTRQEIIDRLILQGGL